MTLPVTIPNQFANATSSIPLSQLDSNFNTLSNVINQINAGTQQLANANVAVLIVDAGTSAAPTITTTGDTNTGIFFPAADTIAFAEGGAEAMRITSAGELLIGTNTAASTQGGNLQVITSQAIRRNVASSAGGALRLEKSRSATDGGYTIVQDGDSLGDIQWFGSDGVDFAHAATVRGIVNGTPGSNDMPGALAFLTSADGSQTPTERMRIDSSGNVGIGASAPAAKLEISSTNGGVTDPLLANTRLRFTDSDTTKANNQVTGGIEWYTADTDAAGVYAYISSATNSAGSGYVTFATGSSSTIAERMRIDSDGNVGIGTSSPSQQLHIANADDAIVLIESTGSDATDDANIQLKTTNGTFTIQNDRSIGTSGALTFAGNTSDNIVIDHNSGNVGIGTSSPATKLDVNGQISGKFTDVGTNTAAQALATNHVSQVTISANTTLTTTVPPAGAQAIVIIVSSGVTSRTVTFGAGFASTGTLATGTTADRRFVVSFVSDGTRLIECSRTAAITV